MARWALVNPPYGEVYGPVAPSGYGELPLGLAYLASALEARGDDVIAVDAMGLGLGLGGVLDRLEAASPDAVGVTCPTPLVPWTLRLLEGVSRSLPDALRVCGGPHATARPEDLLPLAHACVVGEGEDTAAELSLWAEGARSPGSVAGLALPGRDGRAVRTAPRPLVEPLDRLPYPARHLFPLGSYSHQYPEEEGGYASLVASRGCAHRCSFCATGLAFGRRVRLREPAAVVDELRLLAREGVGFALFLDDGFTAVPAFARALSRRIRDARLGLRWACLARADRVDAPTLRAMREGGCAEVQVGVESGDQRVLDLASKGTTLAQVRRAFRLLKAEGMRTKGFFMLGMPGETPPSARRTLELALELDPDYALFGVFVPYPGAPCFPSCEPLLTTRDWSRFCWYLPPVADLGSISPEEVERARREAARRFFLRPSKLVSNLPALLRSPGRALRSARAALSLASPL